MSGSYLLDTSIAIEILEGRLLVDQFDVEPGEVLLSSTVVGEMAYGACNSEQRERNLAKLSLFTSRFPILPVDVDTAHHYGDVKAGLRRLGRPIPENDIWIAATAVQYGLTLAARDSHFEHVGGLKLETW